MRLWDPATGAPVGQPLKGHTSSVESVAFGAGAGGQPLLASAGWDRTVRLWDPATGARVGQPLTGHTGWVQSVAFGAGAGGQPLLASAGWDRTVRLWDPATGAPVGQPLKGHTRNVRSVAFGTGAGGQPLLASADTDGTVRLWDPATGALVAALRRRPPAHSVAFAGEAVVIGDDEGITLIELDAYEPAGPRPSRPTLDRRLCDRPSGTLSVSGENPFTGPGSRGEILAGYP